MVALQGSNVFLKLWYFLRTYILVLKRFDLFLQGALLIIILLQSNAFLLLRRDAGTGSVPALLEDWVYIGSGVAEFVFGAILAWWGRSRRHLVLSLWLGITAAVALIVLAFPYDEPSPTRVELCGGEPVSSYTVPLSLTNMDATARARVAMLILTVIMCSLSMVSIWAHGLTYLDDHEPHNGAYFYGILISIRLSLGLSGQNWLRAGAVRDDWWEAQISLAMLTLMFSVLFTLFPKRMTMWQDYDVKDNTGFFASLGRVVRNKAIVVQTLAISLLNTAVFGFVQYDSAFVQARFHAETVRQDPRTSRANGDIFRSLVVIFFVMIFRVRFSDRRADGVKANTASKVGGVLSIFVAIFFGVLAALHCTLDDIPGVVDGVLQPPDCSEQCGCDSGRYGFAPVCALDTSTTFFSPCHAGCSDYEDLHGFPLFHNCTCGSERAVRGSCTMASCRTVFGLYQIFQSIAIAMSAASLLMQGMVMLRAVKRHDKPTAIGASFAFSALVSSVCGHLLYMLMSHLTCAYWGNDGTACLLNQPTFWCIAVVSAGLALLSAVLSIVASKFRYPSDILSNTVVDDDR